MRELTEAEKVAKDTAWQLYTDSKNNIIVGEMWGFVDGFIAGLETQDSRIALLESRIAELESVLKLMELEVE